MQRDYNSSIDAILVKEENSNGVVFEDLLTSDDFGCFLKPENEKVAQGIVRGIVEAWSEVQWTISWMTKKSIA